MEIIWLFSFERISKEHLCHQKNFKLFLINIVKRPWELSTVTKAHVEDNEWFMLSMKVLAEFCNMYKYRNLSNQWTRLYVFNLKSQQLVIKKFYWCSNWMRFSKTHSIQKEWIHSLCWSLRIYTNVHAYSGSINYCINTILLTKGTLLVTFRYYMKLLLVFSKGQSELASAKNMSAT